MSELENGMLVQHASLGLGRIVALEPRAVHVFFAESDARFATKLRLPMVLPLLTPSQASNAWLSGLSAFALDAETGRYRRGGTTWLSHADAVARFLEAFPQGFADPRYLGDGKSRRERVARWRRAHELFEETLGRGEGERLLAADDVAGLTARALKIERLVAPLHRAAERASLEEGLRDPGAARAYFAALLAIAAEPEPERSRFEAVAAAVAAMPRGAAPESAWPTATLLPFVARPDRHMPLLPRSSCDAAQRLGLELSYEAAPCWRTYSALLGSAALLLEKLRPLGARDHVDVEAFMHVIAARTARPKARPGLAPPSPEAASGANPDEETAS